MKDNVKYALYSYSTHNIGDEIQSVAARQFLPKVDYYIDRDRVGEWTNNSQDEEVRLIANGWYMHDPMSWPIQDRTLKPLLTSMHLNDTDKRVLDRFSTVGSKDYMQSLGQTVGARDKTTEKIFKDLGIDAEFSGCLTLTLQKDPAIKKADFILCVTTSDEVYDLIRSKTDRTVIKIDTLTFEENLLVDDKMSLAEQYLYLYQSAHLVVTTRLHAMLPCLTFETPVIHINDSGPTTYDPSRLHGLSDLVNNISEQEFIQGINDIDLENPRPNPETFKKIRDGLISDCEAFTGNRIAKSFAKLNDFSKLEFKDNGILKTILYNYDQEKLDVKKLMKNTEEAHSSQVEDLSKEIDSTKRELSEAQQRIGDLEAELDKLNSIKTSFKKLTDNIKDRIR